MHSLLHIGCYATKLPLSKADKTKEESYWAETWFESSDTAVKWKRKKKTIEQTLFNVNNCDIFV